MIIKESNTIDALLNFIRILEFKIQSVKILKVNICFLIFYGVAMSQIITNQNSEIGCCATISGIVTDYSGAIIADANIIIEGTHRYEVITSEDGSYSLNLPSDIYQIRVETLNRGFCPTVRSAVYLEKDSKTTMNFPLFGCYTVYLSQLVDKEVKELEHPSIGGFTFEKIFPQSLKESKVKEIGISYGEKKQVKGTTIYTADVLPDIKKIKGSDYAGVLLTYNFLSIQAQKITINSNSEIIAEGNVLIEEKNRKREKLKIVKLKIVKDNLIIKSTKN